MNGKYLSAKMKRKAKIENKILINIEWMLLEEILKSINLSRATKVEQISIQTIEDEFWERWMFYKKKQLNIYFSK